MFHNIALHIHFILHAFKTKIRAFTFPKSRPRATSNLDPGGLPRHHNGLQYNPGWNNTRTIPLTTSQHSVKEYYFTNTLTVALPTTAVQLAGYKKSIPLIQPRYGKRSWNLVRSNHPPSITHTPIYPSNQTVVLTSALHSMTLGLPKSTNTITRWWMMF